MTSAVLISKWLEMWLPESLAKLIMNYGEKLNFICVFGPTYQHNLIDERFDTIKTDALFHLSSEFSTIAKDVLRREYKTSMNEPIAKHHTTYVIKRLSIGQTPIVSEYWVMTVPYIRHIPTVKYNHIDPPKFLYRYVAVWTYSVNGFKELELCIPPWEQDNQVYIEICRLVAYSLARENFESASRRNITIKSWNYP